MSTESLLSVVTAAVGPPMAIAGAGYLLGRWRDIDVEPLSTVTIYLFLPALIFHSLVTMSLDVGILLSLGVVMVVFTAVMVAIAAGVAKLTREEGTVLRGAALAAGFPNVGNFGIPVATFAFGQVGRTTAVVFVLIQNVLLYTFGVYVLSRGNAAGDRVAAVKRVLSLPMTYAVIAAGAALALDVVPPRQSPVMQTIGMLGDASIPIFLAILGLQLAQMTPSTAVKRTSPIVGVKVLIAPVVAAAVLVVIGIANDVASQAFLVLSAGPAAVTPLVLTIEFAQDDEAGLSAADFVGTVNFLTILGSLPVVVGLIFLVRTGAI